MKWSQVTCNSFSTVNRLSLGYLCRCRSVLRESQPPKSSPGWRAGCTGSGAANTPTASSASPLLGDGRNTAGEDSSRSNKLLNACPKLAADLSQYGRHKHKAQTTSGARANQLTMSHSLHVLPFSFLRSSFLRTTAM